MRTVTVIGMGLSPEDLTEKHKKVIYGADILMGGERLLSYFKDATMRKKTISKDLEEVQEFIRSHMEENAIVVLASGDPLFFGIGARLVKAIGAENVVIYPNI